MITFWLFKHKEAIIMDRKVVTYISKFRDTIHIEDIIADESHDKWRLSFLELIKVIINEIH